MPGRFMPLWLAEHAAVHDAWQCTRGCPRYDVTSSSMRPSLMRMRLPVLTSLASIVVRHRESGRRPRLGAPAPGRSLRPPSARAVPAAHRCECADPAGRQGSQPDRPSSAATRRTSAIVRACCSCVPCEKLMRATSSPDWISSRIAIGRVAARAERTDDLGAREDAPLVARRTTWRYLATRRDVGFFRTRSAGC